MRTDDIVGYSYRADNYGPECIMGMVAQAGLTTLEFLEIAKRNKWTVERQLDDIAQFRGIDRQDESSFDSGDFPKVIFRDQLQAGEHCGSCRELLG